MSTRYERYVAVYSIEAVNDFSEEGWELVGSPTSDTHPDTGAPATCWTMGKPKPRQSLEDLGGQLT
jgi:hypothetical protein